MIAEKLKISILNKYFQEDPLKNKIDFIKFEEVASLTSGQDLTADRYYKERKENSIPYITGASNIQNDKLIINRYTDTPTSIANKNDILLTCKGTIGEMHILELEKVHIARQFMAITCKEINIKYMYYFLKMKVPYFISEGKSIIPGIKRDTLIKMEIPVPSKEEQEKIVSKIELLFSKLDEIIPIEEKLKRIKEKFPGDIKKAILEEAYTGKWSSSFNEWKEETLENICEEITTGNSISESVKKNIYAKVKEGYNYIGTKDLDFDHTFDYENGIKIPYEESGFKNAKPNDILLCIEGGSAGRKIGILEQKVCYGNKLCKFAIKEEINSKYLYYYLQSPIFLKNFYDNLSGIIGGVSIAKIRKIKIMYPNIKEQERMVEKIEKILSLVDEIEKIYK